MDGAQVGVFEKSNQIGFGGFLQSEDSTALESEFRLVLMGDFSHQSLEREFSHQKFSGLLVLSDFSQSNSSRSESVGLLDSSSGRGTLSSVLSSQLLSGDFSSGLLSSSQLSSGHFSLFINDYKHSLMYKYHSLNAR